MTTNGTIAENAPSVSRAANGHCGRSSVSGRVAATARMHATSSAVVARRSAEKAAFHQAAAQPRADAGAEQCPGEDHGGGQRRVTEQKAHALNQAGLNDRERHAHRGERRRVAERRGLARFRPKRKARDTGAQQDQARDQEQAQKTGHVAVELALASRRSTSL